MHTKTYPAPGLVGERHTGM